MTVVGDDAQAIYWFRVATVRNILEFPDAVPRRATVIAWSRTTARRSRSSTRRTRSSRCAPQRHEKTLWSDARAASDAGAVTCLDEAEQCDAVCRRVLRAPREGIALKQQAVLFRAGHHSDLLEVELARRNIPFVKYGGLKFLEAAHVKDMLALLRILENPRDEVSWFRVLQLPDGIGPGDGPAARWTSSACAPESTSERPSPLRPAAWTTPVDVPAGRASTRRAATLATRALGELLDRRRDPRRRRPGRAHAARSSSRCSRAATTRPRPASRDLEQLEQLAARFPSRADGS